MKSLLLLVLMAVAGTAAGGGLFVFKPQLSADTDLLMLRLNRLEHEIAALRERPTAVPTYDRWERFEGYFSVYENLKLDRLPPDKTDRPELGGEQWGGVMNGPTLDLLLAARITQSLVPVYFDRIAVKGDTAQMTFYVLGSREH